MDPENKLNILPALYDELLLAKELVYNVCGFKLTNFKTETESLEYNASSFYLNDISVKYRLSKITPTKTGQFVTIWKRNNDGVTAPFDYSDEIDLIVITAKKNNRLGQFIFPRSILAEKGIISRNGKQGKRGIRVYPPWDAVTSKQAEKTQNWQKNYFLEIKNPTDPEKIMRLLKKE